MIQRSSIFIIVFVAICSASSGALAQQSGYDRFIGEVIGYDVRSLGVKQAEAVLEIQGRANVSGRDVYVLSFQAKGSNFFDSEKIYADQKDLFPLRVERDLNIFGSLEKITEVYDQEKFIVTITKTTKDGSRTENIVLRKKARIDNIYCFIYRYRLLGDFKIGSSLRLNLPTKDVSVKIAKKTTLDAAGKTFSAFFLETVPSQYRMWFDISKDKLPLRIDKPAMVAGTSMIMTSYTHKGVENDTAR